MPVSYDVLMSIASTAERLPKEFNGKPEAWSVSSLGSVLVSSLGRAFNAETSRFLQGARNGKSLGILVKINGKSKFKVLTVLVAEAFVPVPEGLRGKSLQVLHIDGNDSNNEATNLKWSTRNQGADLGDIITPDVPPVLAKEPGGAEHKEQWRRFRGSQYYVSSLGRVFSAKSTSLVAPYENNLGYFRARLSGIGHFFVHRLVAEAFIPIDETRTIVNHKDGNPSNNAVWNCEWVTHKENTQHAVKTGLIKAGSRHHKAVLTEVIVDDLRRRYASGQHTFQSLATELGVSRHTVARAITGKSLYTSSLSPLERVDSSVVEAKRNGSTYFWSKTTDKRDVLRAERESRLSRALSVEEVLAVREALASGMGQQQAADSFGLPIYTVAVIAERRTYDWVVDADSTPPKPGPKNLAEKARTGKVDRSIVTIEIIEDIIKLKSEGLTTKEVSGLVGYHPGTVKLIVQSRHPLQKGGLAPKMPDRVPGRVVGTITKEMIIDLYKRHLWGNEPVYIIGKDLGISAPSQDAIVHGRHYLQREGAVPAPEDWLASNPPPLDYVRGAEATLTRQELENWFSDFKNGSSPESIAKRAGRGVGTATVSSAITGGLVRQRRGELPLPPVGLQEGRRTVPPAMADADVIAAVIRLRTEDKLDLGSIAERLSLSHDIVKRINQNKHFLQVGGDAPLMPRLRKREIPSKQKVTPEVASRILTNAAAGMGLNANCRAVGLGPPTVKKVLRGQHPVQLFGGTDAKA
jgi:hypothetical protein